MVESPQVEGLTFCAGASPPARNPRRGHPPLQRGLRNEELAERRESMELLLFLFCDRIITVEPLPSSASSTDARHRTKVLLYARRVFKHRSELLRCPQVEENARTHALVSSFPQRTQKSRTAWRMRQSHARCSPFHNGGSHAAVDKAVDTIRRLTTRWLTPGWLTAVQWLGSG